MLGMPSVPPALRRPRNLVLLAAAVVLAVAVVGPWLYINVIREDAPDRLTLADAPAATTTSTATAGTDGATSETGIDGSWTVGDGTIAGYRAKEVLFGQDAEAAGRTEEVTGTLAASGTSITAVEVVVDMTTITSPESRRDGQFHGRIMSTSQFPTATFVLSEPIELGTLPAVGEEVSIPATGELTLRGVTRSVTVDLQAVLRDGSIVVNATIPIDFDDYEIPDASGGPASVGRSGEIELLVVFTR